MKKVIFITISVLVAVIAFGVFIFKPIPTVKEKDTVTINGIVVDIYDAGLGDVVFKLSDNNTNYYINRGFEKGLNIDSLKKKLVGNQVVLKYPDYRTLLDKEEKSRHLSKVEFNNEVIFNELR